MQEKAEREEMTPAEHQAFLEMLRDLREIENLIRITGKKVRG
jgi:hypothetical protein